MTYRDPNQVAPVPGIERAYSDWSEIPNEDQEVSTQETLKALECATDELTRANMESQTLLTDFGIECENAELDGQQQPTEFTEAERKQLRSALSSAREALKYLMELEAQHA